MQFPGLFWYFLLRIIFILIVFTFLTALAHPLLIFEFVWILFVYILWISCILFFCYIWNFGTFLYFMNYCWSCLFSLGSNIILLLRLKLSLNPGMFIINFTSRLRHNLDNIGSKCGQIINIFTSIVFNLQLIIGSKFDFGNIPVCPIDPLLGFERILESILLHINKIPLRFGNNYYGDAKNPT